MGELREREKVIKVREWESSGKGRTQKHIQTTVFVSNLPPRLHWKGLWFAFARYGEVIDAFIPTKKSKTGFRYDFVRFLSLEDADRTILHLNGSVLYGNRLNASLARFSDNLEDRKSKQMKNNELRNRETRKNLNIRVAESSSVSPDTLTQPRLKRVLGHVDEEALKKLEKCLIDTMATVCSTSQVEDPLQAWGLNDVTVKYMGGRRFLIDIKDQELKSKLQLQDWAILKEIFSEIETWNELFHMPERNTWIQRGRTNEVIEVEAGRDCFLVQVDELGLTFHSKQRVVPLQSKAKMTVDCSPESSSDSSSVSDHYTVSTNRSRSNCNGEDEVAKAICLEKGPLVDEISSKLNAGRSLG
ncbi:hypothetical protein V6N13_129070 [Hibiscus sabdariffa]